MQNRHRNICRECATEDPRIEAGDSACRALRSKKKAKTPGEKQCGFIDCVPRNGCMFVADAQCMCDRSYEEDDAEDDEVEDTGYGQHRTQDLLKFCSNSVCDRGLEGYLDQNCDNNEKHWNFSCFLRE